MSGMSMVALVETGSVNPAMPALVSSCSTITVSLSTSSGMRIVPVRFPIELGPAKPLVIVVVAITSPDWSSTTISTSPIPRPNVS